MADRSSQILSICVECWHFEYMQKHWIFFSSVKLIVTILLIYDEWECVSVCLSVCMVKRRNVKENQLSLLFNLAKKIVLYILFTLVSKKRCLPLRVFNFQCFKFTWKLAMKKKVEKSNWEKNAREKKKNGFNDNKHLLRIRSNYFIISENGKCPTNLFQIRSILLL